MTDSIAIPGYRIERQLGQGGMASVYLAIQESFDREVALKVMSPLLNSDPAFPTRFMREARIVAQIHHASIVPVMDVGQHESHHYLSMEYLPGGDLKQRIQAGHIGLDVALNVGAAMSSALDLAHRKGFVHRDLKPENILFREDGTPVLTDFGIARAIDSGSSLTVAGTLVGTPNYMSPEQLKGTDVDGRSDLYSLGIVFYEMLTGAAPFRADSTMSLAMKHLTEPLPRLPPQYSIYQAFVDRLTAKHRDERFASGADALQALKMIGNPAVARENTLIRPRPLLPPRSPTPRPEAARAADPVDIDATAKTLARLPPERFSISTTTVHARSAPWSRVAAVAALAIGAGYLLGKIGDELPASQQGEVAAATPQSAVTEPPQQQPTTDTATTTPASVEPPEVAAATPSSARNIAISNTAVPLPTSTAAPDNTAAKPAAAPARNKNPQPQRRELDAEALAKKEQQIRQLLVTARNDYMEGRLVQPPGTNAVDRYRVILELDPKHSEALTVMRRIADIYATEARYSMAAGDRESAQRLLDRLRAVEPAHPQLADLNVRFEQMVAVPLVLKDSDREDLLKARRHIAKAYEYLEQKPVFLRRVAWAADQYTKAASLVPQTPGLPLLRDRITVAYVIAAQTALKSNNKSRVLEIIAQARERGWFSTELQDVENSMQAGTG